MRLLLLIASCADTSEGLFVTGCLSSLVNVVSKCMIPVVLQNIDKPRISYCSWPAMVPNSTRSRQQFHCSSCTLLSLSTISPQQDNAS